MRLYFIRHAQSENNYMWEREAPPEERSEDPELTEYGRRQARHLGRFLSESSPEALATRHDPKDVAGFGITHIYCSLMQRAVQTALAISREVEVPVEAWPDVHEGGGIWNWEGDPADDVRVGLPGPNRAYFTDRYPDLVLPEALGDEGWWNRDVEPRDLLPGRARQFLDDLLERHGGTSDRVVVVSHAGFYDRFIHAVLRLPEESGFWFVINNAGITSIDFHEDGDVVLLYMNRTDFLPKEIIT
jgi:2,3-bisphosphoglycerate-dependent phosphoglycerate mutase